MEPPALQPEFLARFRPRSEFGQNPAQKTIQTATAGWQDKKRLPIEGQPQAGIRYIL